MKINDVVKFKSCVTCVYRKPYPPATREGQPVFFRFLCSRGEDSQKEVVRPEESCDCWKGADLGVE
jgi:hypothetical protein